MAMLCFFFFHAMAMIQNTDFGVKVLDGRAMAMFFFLFPHAMTMIQDTYLGGKVLDARAMAVFFFFFSRYGYDTGYRFRRENT